MLFSLLSVFSLGMWSQMSHMHAETQIINALPIAPPAQELVVQDYLTASGVVILNAKSGQIVYAKQADITRPMASITKLMTALIIVENHDMSEMVTVPKGIETVVGNKAYLKSGERFTVGSLLSALLISSANDAAVVLAIHHSNSTAEFVEEMNLRAEQLGLEGTSYANPSGLDSINQYSTPRDIAWLTMHAYNQPEIAKRMGKRWATIYSMQGTDIPLSHTHELLHTASSTDTGSGFSVTAGKTGTTDGAKECLVSIVEHENEEYVVVIMKSIERYNDMQIILDSLTDIIPVT